MKIVAEKIKEMRIEKSLTQADVAKILGISRAGYGRYETNEREIPIELLCKLADYYHVSMDYLTGRRDF